MSNAKEPLKTFPHDASHEQVFEYLDYHLNPKNNVMKFSEPELLNFVAPAKR